MDYPKKQAILGARQANKATTKQQQKIQHRKLTKIDNKFIFTRKYTKA
jgi:hypothetical protein